MQGSSDIPGFYKLSSVERRKLVQELTGLSDDEMQSISNTGGLPVDVAERMIENVIGG
ncbi:MAG: 3-hydroxy-3-methylglutaryl-CoA reductase, partial [Thaumarchaeota archaeon]|nr:3-hydroxy-3-methylglutaryl-CoA reductase [Nitrososphaerota archaeon]